MLENPPSQFVGNLFIGIEIAIGIIGIGSKSNCPAAHTFFDFDSDPDVDLDCRTMGKGHELLSKLNQRGTNPPLSTASD